jgi:hypothetical protein
MLRVLSRLAVVALVLPACQSQPPYSPFPVDPAGTGRYATKVLCSPDEETAYPVPQIVGPPDGVFFDTSKCQTLDVFFGGGTLKTLVDLPDLAIHLAEESATTCPQDCTVCDPPDGQCEVQESFLNCREDCLRQCGVNGSCDNRCRNKPDDKCAPSENESCFTCPEDCGPCTCGDKPCLPGCGDQRCDVASSESCLTCPQDCGPCLSKCGDGRCERITDEPLQAETCLNCPADCQMCRQPDCGDNKCEPPRKGIVTVSDQGKRYNIVSFINFKPTNTPESCRAVMHRNWALIFFDFCNTISNVSHLRIDQSDQQPGGERYVRIDAFEALSFEPKKEQ